MSIFDMFNVVLMNVTTYIPMRYGAHLSTHLTQNDSSENSWMIAIVIFVVIIGVFLYYRSQEIKPTRKFKNKNKD